MTFKEVFKMCLEYPGLNLEIDSINQVKIISPLFANGYDYFMMIVDTCTKIVVFYPKVCYEHREQNYYTNDYDENGSEFHYKRNEIFGLTEKRLKTYLDDLSLNLKKAVEKKNLKDLERDFR